VFNKCQVLYANAHIQMVFSEVKISTINQALDRFMEKRHKEVDTSNAHEEGSSVNP